MNGELISGDQLLVPGEKSGKSSHAISTQTFKIDIFTEEVIIWRCCITDENIWSQCKVTVFMDWGFSSLRLRFEYKHDIEAKVVKFPDLSLFSLAVITEEGVRSKIGE